MKFMVTQLELPDPGGYGSPFRTPASRYQELTGRTVSIDDRMPMAAP